MQLIFRLSLHMAIFSSSEVLENIKAADQSGVNKCYFNRNKYESLGQICPNIHTTLLLTEPQSFECAGLHYKLGDYLLFERHDIQSIVLVILH